MTDLDALSPNGRYLWHCARGELAFQRNAEGRPVFYPRLIAPGSGGALEWEVSAGTGEVYAVTVVHQKGEAPFALALIALDEGFRLMSVVDCDQPERVSIGDRVCVAFRPLAEGQHPLPVFTLTGASK